MKHESELELPDSTVPRDADERPQDPEHGLYVGAARSANLDRILEKQRSARPPGPPPPPILDSGARRSFGTGSVRDAAVGKGRYDLLPPRGLARLARHFEDGAAKYGDRNWEKGQPQHVFVDSGLRHAFRYLAGDRDEDHLVAAVWNFLCAMDQEERAARGRGELAELIDVGPRRRPDTLPRP